MLFTIKNLGKLQEAEIDLGKDILLLTGRNNTSKTYAAYAIYGLYQQMPELLAESVLPALLSWSELKAGVDLVEFVQAHQTKILSSLSDAFVGRLPDVFAAGSSFGSATRIHLALDADTRALRELIRSATDGRIVSSEAVQIVGGADGHITAIPKNGGSDEARNVVATAMVAGLLAGVLFRHFSQPYILTAERAALQLFGREIARNRARLVDELMGSGGTLRSLSARQGGRTAQRYSLPIRESLDAILDAATSAKVTSPFESYADALEDSILQGGIRVGEEGDLLFHPAGGGVTLEMHLTSSIVKSLAPLSFYLRHRAREGDFLIIDEPELNLHPDNQRRIARLLARLSRAGVKVMMSTHSDYIIRELNNLIALHSDRTGELRQKHGYREDEVLDPARVGAYLFDAERAHRIDSGRRRVSVQE